MMYKMKSLYKFGIDLIFPNRCPCCDKFIKWDELICDNCIKEMKSNNEKANNYLTDEYPDIDKIVYFTEYEGPGKRGIISLKKGNNTNFAEYAGFELGRKILETEESTPDAILPIPMRFLKKQRRGYNQAELIAKGIRNAIDVKIDNKIIKKNIMNLRDRTQHELNAAERHKNAERIYILNKNSNVGGKSFIICDDVLTTGATVGRCAKLLKESGAERIIVAVATVTMRKEEGK